MTTKEDEIRLTVRKSDALDDWWVIERADHDGRMWMEARGRNGMALMFSGRFSDADVEGYGHEMHDIAKAIETRTNASHKRCSVSVWPDGRVEFSSPRNSRTPGVTTLAAADELAALIRKTVPA